MCTHTPTVEHKHALNQLLTLYNIYKSKPLQIALYVQQHADMYMYIKRGCHSYLELVGESSDALSWDDLREQVDLCPQSSGRYISLPASDELIQSIVDERVLCLWE